MKWKKVGVVKVCGSCLFQSFCPRDHTTVDNLYDEESNKYLSKLGGQIEAQLQLVVGGGEQVKGEGYLTMSVAFQKIISPSSATFPGRRGSNQTFSLPLSSPV